MMCTPSCGYLIRGFRSEYSQQHLYRHNNYTTHSLITKHILLKKTLTAIQLT